MENKDFEKYKDFIAEKLKELMSINSPTGYTDEAANYMLMEFKKLGIKAEKTIKGGILVNMEESNSPSTLLEAHIDTLGAMVSEVKSNGRLELTALGGLNPNNTEGENARLITKFNGEYEGTFQLNNASIHVNGEYNDIKRAFDKMELVLDEDVNTKEDTIKLGVNTGDIVCFDPRFRVTEKGYIKSRFLDDKLSAIILLAFAKYIKDHNISLRKNVYMHFTVYEEVGHGGAASVPNDIDEAISVDMGCVGDKLSCTEKQVSICVKDSGGPYSYAMVKDLIKAAKDLGVDYALDIYPHYGSDVEATLSAGHDIRHALIGPGVYASHGYERSHLDGAINTLSLLISYLKK